MRDDLEVRAPDVLRERRQHVVPDRREGADQLRDARGACHEPDVQVLAAVAPAAHVHVADVADRVDGTLHADQQRAELAGEIVGKIEEVDVLPRMQEHDAREARRAVERVDDPVVVVPERALDASLAAPATDAAGAVTRRSRLDRRLRARAARPRPRTATCPTPRPAARSARRARAATAAPVTQEPFDAFLYSRFHCW